MPPFVMGPPTSFFGHVRAKVPPSMTAWCPNVPRWASASLSSARADLSKGRGCGRLGTFARTRRQKVIL